MTDQAPAPAAVEQIVRERLEELAVHFETEQCDCRTADAQSLCGCGVAETIRGFWKP